jgi:hypothetical protein
VVLSLPIFGTVLPSSLDLLLPPTRDGGKHNAKIGGGLRSEWPVEEKWGRREREERGDSGSVERERERDRERDSNWGKNEKGRENPHDSNFFRPIFFFIFYFFISWLTQFGFGLTSSNSADGIFWLEP